MKDDHVDPLIRDFVRSQSDIDIDRYSGKGGFGELYFGSRKILGDRVALKFYALDPMGKAHEEPIILKEIAHENIIPIVDARILNSQIAYYLTPEISGGDLQNVIDHDTLSTGDAIRIIQGVLKGLNELHKSPRHLVHRDLKTSNILIDKATGQSFLADFGSVKKIPTGSEYVTASKFSFLYRPPEVVVDGHYYKQSDIYQVGIILYQVLGGWFPLNRSEKWIPMKFIGKYNQLSPVDQQVFLNNIIDEMIVKGKLLNLDSLPNYINKRLKSIIRSATAADIKNRYANCADFLKALYNYQKDSKSWKEDNGIIYAYSEKKKKDYRISK